MKRDEDEGFWRDTIDEEKWKEDVGIEEGNENDEMMMMVRNGKKKSKWGKQGEVSWNSEMKTDMKRMKEENEFLG